MTQVHSTQTVNDDGLTPLDPLLADGAKGWDGLRDDRDPEVIPTDLEKGRDDDNHHHDQMVQSALVPTVSTASLQNGDPQLHLPKELLDDYRAIERIDKESGQAVVFQVAEQWFPGTIRSLRIGRTPGSMISPLHHHLAQHSILGLPALIRSGVLHDDRQFEVLEWIEGLDLERLQSDGPFSEADLEILLFEGAITIESCLAAGVVLGDIKRSNTIDRGVDASGFPRFVFIDLGSARLAAEGTSDTDWIALGTMISVLSETSAERTRRWSDVISGLTRHGWKREEVHAWLRDDPSPSSSSENAAIPPHQQDRPQESPLGSHQSDRGDDGLVWLTFGHRFSADPRALADAIGARFDLALEEFSGATLRAQLGPWVEQFDNPALRRQGDRLLGPGPVTAERLHRFVHALWDTQLPPGANLGVSRYWLNGNPLDVREIRTLVLHALSEISSGQTADFSETASGGIALTRGTLAMMTAGGPATPVTLIARRYATEQAQLHTIVAAAGLHLDGAEWLRWDLELLLDLSSDAAAARRAYQAGCIVTEHPRLADLLDHERREGTSVAITVIARAIDSDPRPTARTRGTGGRRRSLRRARAHNQPIGNQPPTEGREGSP